MNKFDPYDHFRPSDDRYRRTTGQYDKYHDKYYESKLKYVAQVMNGLDVKQEADVCSHGYAENCCVHGTCSNFKLPKEKPVAKGAELIRPGDIQDAIDSTDLLDRLVAENTTLIESKVRNRVVNKWITLRKKELREEYIAKAKKAYEKMWAICAKSTAGHNFMMTESVGYNVHICQDCKFAAPSTRPNAPGGSQASFAFSREKQTTDGMNGDLVKALADKMIEVDIEAGLFTWPTADDYTGETVTVPGKKKRRIFG